MKAEPYDIARMASLLIRLLMGFGTSTDDAIRALQLAERMLRDAEEKGDTHGRRYPAAARGRCVGQ